MMHISTPEYKLKIYNIFILLDSLRFWMSLSKYLNLNLPLQPELEDQVILHLVALVELLKF